MNKPAFIAQFSALSKTGCWHFYGDENDNLTISWLEYEKENIMPEKSVEKVLEVLDRLGSHIADAVDIARKAIDALPDLDDLDEESRKKVVEGVCKLVKKMAEALK